jgi:mannose-6-phosphate isomerase-like protein (cupin superfamily)
MLIKNEYCVAGASLQVMPKAAMAWNLVDEENLSIKLEQMPEGEEEAPHYHEHAHQFFYFEG